MAKSQETKKNKGMRAGKRERGKLKTRKLVLLKAGLAEGTEQQESWDKSTLQPQQTNQGKGWTPPKRKKATCNEEIDARFKGKGERGGRL